MRSGGLTRGEPSVAAAVGRFAVAGILAVAIVGLASFLLMRRIGTSEATDNASDVTRVIGRGIVEPRLNAALLRGDPDAIASFDRAMHASVLNEDLVRVKLWEGSGRIVYSDEPRLIGRRFELGEDETLTLNTGSADADVSDLDEPENQFERDQGKLLEAYSQVTAPSGQNLLFETYQQYSAITSSGRSLWLAFAPALIAALVLLELIQLPLASALARRVRGAHRDRVKLLERAVDASDRERRRIAGDLHDGAVQDLAGVALSLEGAARRIEARDGPSAEALRRGAEQTRGNIRSLRNLLVEIYPPSLERAGLRSALEDLLTPLEIRGIGAELELDDGINLPPELQATCFRVAQEALRNAIKHADPARVAVRLSSSGDGCELTVTDDGRGYVEGDRRDGPQDSDGHIGTELMEDLAAESGGEFSIESVPGRGTVVRLRLPVR